MVNFGNIFNLDGRSALVTGGSRGIGRSISIGLAAFGANVAIAVSNSVDEAESVAAEIHDLERQALVLQADVSRKQDVNKLIDRTVTEFGRLDILVNNAGTSHRAATIDFDESEFDRVIAVNLKGAFLCAQAAGREMIRLGMGGSIINITSIAGVVGVPGTIAYSASKGGVTQLTRALAIEWASSGIRVNSIAPCPVRTPLVEEVFSKQPEVFNELVRKIPLGRAAKPEDIVGAAVFLASDASSMITGHTLSVDGGWVAN